MPFKTFKAQSSVQTRVYRSSVLINVARLSHSAYMFHMMQHEVADLSVYWRLRPKCLELR
jgi:hypothetical protein